MTTRFSLFSHIEDLATGQLVLTSAFRNQPDQPTMCRFELHRQSEKVLNPDPAWVGVTGYHQLLSLDQKMAQSIGEIPILDNWENIQVPLESTTLSAYRAVANTNLPFVFALAQASAEGIEKITGPLLGANDFDFLSLSENTNHQLAMPERFRVHAPKSDRLHFYDEIDGVGNVAGFTSVGPWTNPFRIEGMKLVGFELYNRLPSPATIVIHDPAGEWSLALAEAAKIIRHFLPDSLPFRIVLVQQQPHDHLCQLFEGRGYDSACLEGAALPAYLPLPEIVQPLLVDGLISLAGTAVSIPPRQASDAPWYQSVLETLVRTGFVDEDDEVVLFEPHPPFQTQGGPN